MAVELNQFEAMLVIHRLRMKYAEVLMYLRCLFSTQKERNIFLEFVMYLCLSIERIRATRNNFYIRHELVSQVIRQSIKETKIPFSRKMISIQSLGRECTQIEGFTCTQKHKQMRQIHMDFARWHFPLHTKPILVKIWWAVIETKYLLQIWTH